MQVAVAAGFVVFTLVATHLLSPRVKTKRKEENFECGIESQGNARFPVSIRYFMTAILFVLFDVEVIFFYPYAVNFHQLKKNLRCRCFILLNFLKICFLLFFLFTA